MSNDPTPPPSPLAALANNRRERALGLAVAGAVLAGLAILCGTWGFARAACASLTTGDGTLVPDEEPAEDKAEEGKPTKSPGYQTATVWAGGLALLFLASAAWVYTQPADPTAPMAGARTEVVTFGGVVGLLTT